MKQILVRTEFCLGCKSCEIACAVAHSESKNLFLAIFEHDTPRKRVFVESDGEVNLPLQCRQCSDRPCVHACMSGAMSVDAETGLVQIETSKCVGCWMCVMVCPFGVISEMSNHKAAKCDRCRDQGYIPACINACPTGALEFTEVDKFIKSGRKTYLEQFKEV